MRPINATIIICFLAVAAATTSGCGRHASKSAQTPAPATRTTSDADVAAGRDVEAREAADDASTEDGSPKSKLPADGGGAVPGPELVDVQKKPSEKPVEFEDYLGEGFFSSCTVARIELITQVSLPNAAIEIRIEQGALKGLPGAEGCVAYLWLADAGSFGDARVFGAKGLIELSKDSKVVVTAHPGATAVLSFSGSATKLGSDYVIVHVESQPL